MSWLIIRKIHSRLLKNKTKEHGITTTENNLLKDGGNQCKNIEKEDNSAAVITSLAAMIALIVIAAFSIVIYMKIKRHTNNKSTFGRRRNKGTLGKWLCHPYISYAVCKNRLFRAFYQRRDIYLKAICIFACIWQ